MRLLLRKLRLFPRVIFYLARSGRGRADYRAQWEGYWSSIRGTGEQGDVLWDSQDHDEFRHVLSEVEALADRALPVIDLGCGNGSWSRRLAQRFDRVVGIDVSTAAIDLAREQSEGVDNVEYRVGDLVDREVARALSDELGEVNIFMRGVLHLIRNQDRSAFVDNLARLLGSRGVLYQIETDGKVLDYMLERPDATGTGLPRPMHKVIEQGILPQGFGPADQRRWFTEDRWEILRSTDAVIHTIRLPDGKAGRIPAHALAARRRA